MYICLSLYIYIYMINVNAFSFIVSSWFKLFPVDLIVKRIKGPSLGDENVQISFNSESIHLFSSSSANLMLK